MKVYQKQSKYVNATCTTCATVGYLFRKKKQKSSLWLFHLDINYYSKILLFYLDINY